MRPARSENGLSEVIGFILILVVVMAAFSIYLTYSVPAQGRENEILHMNEVRDQFVTYKVGVDALWTNSQVGTAMSTTFNLGTAGTATQGGGFSIIPVMNPVPSSGTLALNQRQEVLTVQSRGLISDGFVKPNQTDVPGSFSLNTTPLQLLVNISDSSNPLSSNLNKRYVVVEGPSWRVNVSVTPVTTYYEHAICVWNAAPSVDCSYSDAYRYNRTDITIDVIKNGVTTLQDYMVYKNIQPQSIVPIYTINLLDDAYGLKNYLVNQQYPMTVTFTKSSSSLTGYCNVSLIDEYDRQASHSVPLGGLEYRAGNNYWIPQTYYYQNGGVFLQQDDGTSTKLPPTITFSYNATDGIIGVKIIELPFQQTNAGNLGGNSPAQVRTQVTGIQNLPYSQTYNNTKWINLSISSNDSRGVAAWLGALDNSANITAGIPRDYYNQSSSAGQMYLLISGKDRTDTLYDIHVEGLRANLSATVQGG
jgi:hypothetical protein